MNSLFVHIGKVWRVWQREGVCGVWHGVTSVLRPLKSGDILIVTGGVGDSARYRAVHVAEELRNKGFQVSVAVAESPWLFSAADRFSVFIFHRVFVTPRIAAFTDRLKKEGKTILFETDDLTFDPELFRKTSVYAQMGELERKLYEHGLGAEILDDPYVEAATTTTSFLASRLRERRKRVFIVPNKLSKEDVSIAEKIYLKRKQEIANRENIVLGYFSGSASHNRDFATIADLLIHILEKHRAVTLAIYGPLEIDSRFGRFGDRVRRYPYVSRKRHWENIARTDINLAPLEVGDPFCESKSELKFFEAGICGVPTVAAATQTFREAIRDGEDGFVAATTEEWTGKLEKLILDPGLRTSMGERARDTALLRYTTESAGNEEYYQYLKSKMVSNKQ